MATAWKVVIGVACACTCGVARADVVKLDELEARVLSERPEVAMSAARIRQADAEIGAAQSGYLPTLSANLDGTMAPGRALIPYRANDGRDYWLSGTQTLAEPSAFKPQLRYGANFGARGTIYDFGRTSSAVEAAHAKYRASEADANARAQLLVLEVRAAYLRWSVAYALWEVARQAEAEAKGRSERVAGLIAEGAAPPSAATGASQQANVAATESERAELELETARLELGFVSAKDMGPESEPDPSFLQVTAQPPPPVGPSSVLPASQEVLAAKPLQPGAATASPLNPPRPLAAPVGQPLGLALQPMAAGSSIAGTANLTQPQPPTAAGTPTNYTALTPAQPTAAGAPAEGPAVLNAAGTLPTAAGAPSAAGGLPADPSGGAPPSVSAPGSTPNPSTPATPAVGPSAAPASASPPLSAATAVTDTNPQIEALEKARTAAEAARRMQSRLSSPAIGYRLSAGIEGQGVTDAKLFPIYGVGVGVTVPLWDGGATSAAEAGARAAAAELSAQLDAERARDKHLRVRRGVQIAHADRLLALAENAVALAETRVKQLQEGPTLATAEQEALAAAQADRTKASAELVRARATRVQLELGL